MRHTLSSTTCPSPSTLRPTIPVNSTFPSFSVSSRCLILLYRAIFSEDTTGASSSSNLRHKEAAIVRNNSIFVHSSAIEYSVIGYRLVTGDAGAVRVQCRNRLYILKPVVVDNAREAYKQPPPNSHRLQKPKLFWDLYWPSCIS
jgi:NDP-sugar pyrophosphorylase family protein